MCLHWIKVDVCVYNYELDYCFALYRAAAAASSSSSLPFLLSKCSIRFGLICLLCRLIVTVADGTIEKRIDKNSSFPLFRKLRLGLTLFITTHDR